MPICDLCTSEVDGEALLCEECRLDPIEVSMEARRRALWRSEQPGRGPQEADL